MHVTVRNPEQGLSWFRIEVGSESQGTCWEENFLPSPQLWAALGNDRLAGTMAGWSTQRQGRPGLRKRQAAHSDSHWKQAKSLGGE